MPADTALNNRVAAFARFTRFGEHGAGAPRRQLLNVKCHCGELNRMVSRNGGDAECLIGN